MACGAARPTAKPQPVIAPEKDGGPDTSTLPIKGPALPTLDAIATTGEAELPEMREVLRTPDAMQPTVVPVLTDGCFRASFAASAPVRAGFVDDSGAPRGAESTGMASLVPPRGPACARKGEALRLVIERLADAGAPDTPIAARAVVWRSP